MTWTNQGGKTDTSQDLVVSEKNAEQRRMAMLKTTAVMAIGLLGVSVAVALMVWVPFGAALIAFFYAALMLVLIAKAPTCVPRFQRGFLQCRDGASVLRCSAVILITIVYAHAATMHPKSNFHPSIYAINLLSVILGLIGAWAIAGIYMGLRTGATSLYQWFLPDGLKKKRPTGFRWPGT